MLERHARGVDFVARSIAIVTTLALVVGALSVLFAPTTVVVRSDRDVWPMGTFHTENLTVDSVALLNGDTTAVTFKASAYRCNQVVSSTLAAGANADLTLATTTNCLYRLTADALNSTITGIDTHANGTFGMLCNVAASGTLTLLNDTCATPADGFALKGGIDRILVASECVQIEYVPTTARWMVIN